MYLKRMVLILTMRSPVHRFIRSAKLFNPHGELGMSEELQANEASPSLFLPKTSPLLYVLFLVAQNRHHPGDWRLPGEEARWCGRPLHRPAHARLPAPSVQAGPQTGPHAGHPHPDPTGHHPGSVAVRQDPQTPGPSWARVYQLWQIPATGEIVSGEASILHEILNWTVRVVVCIVTVLSNLNFMIFLWQYYVILLCEQTDVKFMN